MKKAIYSLALSLSASRKNYTKENFDKLTNLLKEFYILSNEEIEEIEVDFIPDIIEEKPKVTKAKKEGETNQQGEKKEWMLYAILSAVFASLTAILGKIGIEGVDSNLGTAIRTTVVLVMAWMMVGITGKHHQVKELKKKELIFIVISGLATGASWLCYYRALQEGLASVVVPIDKLSILVTILFSWIVFHEKLSKKAAWGLVCIVVGTLLLVVI